MNVYTPPAGVMPPIVPVPAFLPVPGVNFMPAGRPATDSQAFDLLVAATVAVVTTGKLNDDAATSDATASDVNLGAAAEGVTANATGVPVPFVLIATTVPDNADPFVRPVTVHEVSPEAGLHDLPPTDTV